MLHKDIYKTKLNNNYLVSVVIPFKLTDTSFFFQLLDCLNSNKRNDFEYIFVDDGNELEISKLAKEQINRIKNSIFIRNDTNRGVSFSRNVGIDNANGKYIMFIDSDDLIDFEILTHDEIFLETNSDDLCCLKFNYFIDNPKCSCKSFEKINFVIKESILSLHNYSYFDSELDEYMLKSACGKLFSKSVINENKIRFKEGLRHFEDYLFVTNYCSVVKQLRLIDGPTFYFYRNNPNSASRSYDPNLSGDIKNFYECFDSNYHFLSDTLTFDTIYVFLSDLIKNEYLNNKIVNMAMINRFLKFDFINKSFFCLKKANTKGILNKYLKRLKAFRKFTPALIWKSYILRFNKKYLGLGQ